MPKTEAAVIQLVKVNDRWNWILWSANGRALMVSAKNFARKADALKSAKKSGADMATAKVMTGPVKEPAADR